jgi:hypothetical protein
VRLTALWIPGSRRLATRKVVLNLGISLDGYIARPDGSVDFLFMPKDCSMAALLQDQRCLHHGP